MSYESKDSKIQKQQLRVQEVVIRFADTGLYTASGSVVTVDLGEAASIVSVLNFDNSGPTPIMIAASGSVVTSTSVAITLGAAFAANDSLVIKYIVTE